MQTSIKLTPDDRVRMKRFYDAIASLAGQGHERHKLSASELHNAEANLAGASPETRQAAWWDVIDVFAGDMDADFLRQTKAELQRMPLLVRPQNRYLKNVELQRVADAALLPEITHLAEVEVRKVALRSALAEQMTTNGEIEADLARDALLNLVDSCKRREDVAFLRQAWILIATEVTDKDGTSSVGVNAEDVAVLSKAFRTFMAKSGSNSEIEKYMEPIHARMEIDPDAAATHIDEAAFERRFNELVQERGTTKMIIDSDKMRVKQYRNTVARIMEDSTVKALLPAIKRIMEEDEEASRAEQAAGGGNIITKKNIDLAVSHDFAKPLYDLTQEVAQKLGITKEVTLVIVPHVMPNAYIYTADLDHPRVTFYTPIVSKFWNTEEQDWLKIWVDKDNNPCERNAEGAHEISVGKLLVESVLAHELGHIRDQVVLTQFIVIYMFLAQGRSLLSMTTDPVKKRDIEKALTEASNMLGDCQLAEGHSHSGHAHAGESAALLERRLQAAGALENLFDANDFRRLLNSIETSMRAEGDAAVPSAAASAAAGGASLTMGDLFRFIYALRKMGRASEATADRYAVVEQHTARWTALMDTILGLDLAPTSSQREKVSSILNLLRMGPEHFADSKLAETAEAVHPESLDFNKERTHPATAARIKANYLFERDPKGFANYMRVYNELSPARRLLAVIQLYEKNCNKLDDEMKTFKPQDGYELLEDLVKEQKVRTKLHKAEEELAPFLELVDTYVGEFGLVEPDNEFVVDAIKFISKNGSSMADNAPLKRLAQRWHHALEVALKRDDLRSTQRTAGQERLSRLATVVERYRDERPTADAEIFNFPHAKRQCVRPHFDDSDKIIS